MPDSHPLIFENTSALDEYLLKKWKASATEAVSKRHRFMVALSGGSSPLSFYRLLASMKEEALWRRTHIFLVDERFVPADHPESNFRMIRESLLAHVPVPSENIHPVPTDTPDVFLAAEGYETVLREGFSLQREEAYPCFDLILLGLGEDGHTASLFPSFPDGRGTDRLVIAVRPPHLSTQRVTLTLPVLNAARCVVFYVTGGRKAKIVKEVLEGQGDYPAVHVHPKQGRLFFLLDREAAQEWNSHENIDRP